MVIQVYMAQGDHSGLIDACVRLGDVSKGGDPQLWNEVLEFLGSQQGDCTQQVGVSGVWDLLVLRVCLPM